MTAVIALIRGWDGLDYGRQCRRGRLPGIHAPYYLPLLVDKLGDLTIRYAGKGPTPLLTEGSLFGARSWMWLEETLGRSKLALVRPGRWRNRDDVMRLALRETVDYLNEELGPQMDDWAWGKLHTLTYSHLLGQVKPLDRLFNRGPYPLGGDGTTIWLGLTTLHDLSNPDVIGPPFRFIADLCDLRNSWGLLAPGQSGQPGSKHYDDQIQAWFNADYHPLLFDRPDVERHAQSRLHLAPS